MRQIKKQVVSVPYQAISSTQGKIKKLLIVYNGSAPSLAFVKDMMQVFSKDAELLVRVANKKQIKEINDLAKSVKRDHYRLIYNKRLDQTDDSSTSSRRYEESIWVRDKLYVSSFEDQWGMFVNNAGGAIYHELEDEYIVHDSIEGLQLPYFGNILIDRKRLYIGTEDLFALREAILKEAEGYLRDHLFPQNSDEYEFISLGLNYGEPEFVKSKRSKPKDLAFTFFRHTDLFMTPTGVDLGQKAVVLVAKVVGIDALHTAFVQDANKYLDMIAVQLSQRDILVLRNPVPFLKINKDKNWVGYFNNAIVEIDKQKRSVWLPCFTLEIEHEANLFLARVAERNRGIWESLNFAVRFVAGGMMHFNNGNNNKGALRCMCVDFR